MTVNPDSGVPVLDLPLRLEIARRAAGYTQATIAPELGLDKSTISDFERGARPPKRGTLIAWSLITGVSLTWLEHGIAAVPGGDGGGAQYTPRDSNPEPADSGRRRLQPVPPLGLKKAS